MEAYLARTPAHSDVVLVILGLLVIFGDLQKVREMGACHVPWPRRAANDGCARSSNQECHQP